MQNQGSFIRFFIYGYSEQPAEYGRTEDMLWVKTIINDIHFESQIEKKGTLSANYLENSNNLYN